MKCWTVVYLFISESSDFLGLEVEGLATEDRFNGLFDDEVVKGGKVVPRVEHDGYRVRRGSIEFNGWFGDAALVFIFEFAWGKMCVQFDNVKFEEYGDMNVVIGPAKYRGSNPIDIVACRGKTRGIGEGLRLKTKLTMIGDWDRRWLKENANKVRTTVGSSGGLGIDIQDMTDFVRTAIDLPHCDGLRDDFDPATRSYLAKYLLEAKVSADYITFVITWGVLANRHIQQFAQFFQDSRIEHFVNSVQLLCGSMKYDFTESFVMNNVRGVIGRAGTAVCLCGAKSVISMALVRLRTAYACTLADLAPYVADADRMRDIGVAVGAVVSGVLTVVYGGIGGDAFRTGIENVANVLAKAGLDCEESRRLSLLGSIVTEFTCLNTQIEAMIVRLKEGNVEEINKRCDVILGYIAAAPADELRLRDMMALHRLKIIFDGSIGGGTEEESMVISAAEEQNITNATASGDQTNGAQLVRRNKVCLLM